MNSFLIQKHLEWAEKLTPEDELFILGDIGDHDFLWVYTQFKAKTHLLLGNHDKHTDIDLFKSYFNIVHEYPFYISDKIAISHVPIGVYPDTINIYGHTHSMIIDKPNYYCVCLEVNNYNLVNEKQIYNRFSQLPKYNRKFLQEPFAEDLKVIDRPQNDLVLKPDGHIDLSAMRVLRWMKNNT